MTKCPTCGHVAKKAGTLDGFDEFWDAFAHKRKAKSAERAWVKNKCSNIKDEIISAAKKYAAWRDPGYGLLPATWLNENAWNDELELSEAAIDREHKELIAKYTAPVLNDAIKRIRLATGLSAATNLPEMHALVPEYVNNTDLVERKE